MYICPGWNFVVSTTSPELFMNLIVPGISVPVYTAVTGVMTNLPLLCCTLSCRKAEMRTCMSWKKFRMEYL